MSHNLVPSLPTPTYFSSLAASYARQTGNTTLNLLNRLLILRAKGEGLVVVAGVVIKYQKPDSHKLSSSFPASCFAHFIANFNIFAL